ncbi:MAG: alpha-D-glucose phosphate-specific phosphoglucomutase [Gammaproteobacteria bacterium]|nr:alpha-D-glucose phosphate-specific phosphoglucomutase [Gammaproteobacteria bacterium]
MNIINRKTRAYSDQKAGTSGLRKKVKHFQQENYLENFIQSLFNTIDATGKTLVLGGDGRFYNREAIQIILRMAVANGIAKLFIGQNGILSTPAASYLIRKLRADGGIILSASHNPGGPEADFGIKFNSSNGGPANTELSDKFYHAACEITEYKITEFNDIDLSTLGDERIGNTEISIVDSVAEYCSLMEHLFDFDRIHNLFNSGAFHIRFDAMHAVTGPYAKEIFEKKLGANHGSVVRAQPLEDFGGGHPDPNPMYASELYAHMFAPDAPDFGAASDGDGDRNMIMGRQLMVSPGDSLAIIAANASRIPGYREGITGIARSMPTSRAVDRVAAYMGIECFETPTGWKYFGNLLDNRMITFCGEESFGTGSDHLREKDGIWAVLFWLNILAERQQSVRDIVHQHWRAFGRHYYCRHDYEGVSLQQGEDVLAHLSEQLPQLSGKKVEGHTILSGDNFCYLDPVDNSLSENQGLRIVLDNEIRIIYRLSGTSTEGATLRVYLERFEPEPEKQHLDTQVALADVAKISRTLAKINELTGLNEPTLIV